MSAQVLCVYLCVSMHMFVLCVNACVCVNTCLYSVVAIDLIFLECPLPKKHAVGEGLVNKL